MKKAAIIIAILAVFGVSSVAGTRVARLWQSSNPGADANSPKPAITTGDKTGATKGNKTDANGKPGHGKEDNDPSGPSQGNQGKDKPSSPTDKTGSGNQGSAGTDSGNAGSVDPVPGEQDRQVYSWWFTRNADHKAPAVDKKAATMLKGKGFYLGDTSGKKVYLTFDEGYENGYTPKILDTLKANSVSAAFFVTGDFVNKNPDLVKRMAAEGHIIGNHTATHPSLPGLTDSKIEQQLQTVHDKVRELTGIDMKYMRPPMGEYNGRVLADASRLGYQTVFWSMAHRDWEVDKQPGKEAAYKHVMDNVHPGAVILLHAVSQSNTEALDDIIKGLKAKGYSFQSLANI